MQQPDKPLGRGADLQAGHQLRRAAALRLEPLSHSGRRDPLTFREVADGIERHDRPEPMSNKQIDGWSDAAHHLLDVGVLPLLPLAAGRALWRRGGHHRELAHRLHAACPERAA